MDGNAAKKLSQRAYFARQQSHSQDPLIRARAAIDLVLEGDKTFLPVVRSLLDCSYDDLPVWERHNRPMEHQYIGFVRREIFAQRYPQLRRDAADCLIRVRDTDSLPIFRNILLTPGASLKSKSIDAIRFMADWEGAVILRKVISDEELGADVENILQIRSCNAIRTLRCSRRWKAVQALGWMGDTKSLPDLRRLLKGTECPRTRSETALAVGRLGDSKSDDLLLTHLNDASSRVRASVIFALSKINTNIPDLEQFALHDEEIVRAAAVWALEEYGSPNAISCCRICLRDRAPAVRFAAVTVLGRLGATCASNEIVSMLEDDFEHESVRGACADALAKLRVNSSEETLRRLLDDHKKVDGEEEEDDDAQEEGEEYGGEDRVGARLAIDIALSLQELGDENAAAWIQKQLKREFVGDYVILQVAKRKPNLARPHIVAGLTSVFGWARRCNLQKAMLIARERQADPTLDNLHEAILYLLLHPEAGCNGRFLESIWAHPAFQTQFIPKINKTKNWRRYEADPGHLVGGLTIGILGQRTDKRGTKNVVNRFKLDDARLFGSDLLVAFGNALKYYTKRVIRDDSHVHSHGENSVIRDVDLGDTEENRRFLETTVESKASRIDHNIVNLYPALDKLGAKDRALVAAILSGQTKAQHARDIGRSERQVRRDWKSLQERLQRRLEHE